MALIDMMSEMSELVPAMSRIRSKRLINRAFKIIQDSCLWSFQLQQGGFSTPSVTTAGSISPTFGMATIVGDAVASAAWLTLPFYWSPTMQQIRANGYSIYSIIALDATNPNAVVLTLDRPFIDPLPFYTGVGYQMFQAYIAAPVGFKRWLNMADMMNCWPMDVWSGRRTTNLFDATRLYTSDPNQVLGVGQDMRGAGTPNASATLGQQLFELYPNPQSQISYQWYAVVQVPYLENNSDTLPHPIDESVVLSKALTWAYRDAEARRDIMAAKGTTGNYLALKKESEADFLARLKTLRLLDRDAVDAYQIDMKAFMGGFRMPYFNSRSGRANMGLGGWR